jgi:hypothetical protein
MRISIRTLALLAGATILTAVSAWAQGAPRPAEGSLDVAITYDALRANATTTRNFWMQGGSVQLHGQFWHGVGVVADVSGQQTANISGSGVGLDLVTATFGPRYTWTKPHSRYAVFGQALGGEAFAFNSVFPSGSNVVSDANSLAIKLGGGINYSLSHRFALRAIEANWLRTQTPNATTSVQNNLALGAGIVYRLPSHR